MTAVGFVSINNGKTRVIIDSAEKVRIGLAAVSRGAGIAAYVPGKIVQPSLGIIPISHPITASQLQSFGTADNTGGRIIPGEGFRVQSGSSNNRRFPLI
jgi:hypothetical protein